MNFSEKLLKLRKEMGMSQEDLGYKINVSRQSVSKWESNQSMPEIDKIKELSNFFNVSIDYLLNDDYIEKTQNIEPKIITKKPKKKIFILLFILILSIYIITVFYKSIALGVLYNIANSFSEDNYWMNVSTEMVTISSIEQNYSETSDFSRDGNVLLIYRDLVLDKTEETDMETAKYILYINKDNHIGYELTYDENEKKYIYNNLDTNLNDNDDYFETNQVKEETLSSIPKNKFLFALNPFCSVSLEKRCIKEYCLEDSQLLSITYYYDDVGLIYLINMYSKDYYKMITYSYDYVPEHFGNTIISPIEDEDFNGKIIFP